MRKPYSFLLVLVLPLLLLSCGNFRKIEKNPDWRVKYEGALNYYAKKDYFKAASLFEQILPIVRGLPEGEKVQFQMAYCQYYQKTYLIASELFKTFYETYGRSTLVEEARFMYAYSLYVSSPNANLDQNSSIQAMAAMQEFLNRYPNSKFMDQALESIKVTQGKLEKKGFDNARQYYKMRQYKAAIVALGNFKKNFPDSKYVEDAQYLIVVAQFNLAEQSIYSRQEERYKEVITSYKELIDKYPDSDFLRDAERLYSESLQKLTKFKNNNNT
ncbi:MAG TPA: outer membrane protein assembly factor BamD [Cyclobacteriaceae bacterium]|nr:outer membrane protein assembly factor BamD [Cyclobacteriaceae bacterium]